MQILVEACTDFLIVSSALLLVFGALSCLVLKLFHPGGRARLLIYSMLVVMPAACLIGSFIPDHHKFPLPSGKIHAVIPSALGLGNGISGQLGGRSVGTGTTCSTGDETADFYPSNRQTAEPDQSRGNFGTFTWKQVLAGVWAVMCVIIMIRSLFLVRKMRLLVKCSDRVTDPNVLAILKQCRNETGLRRSPRLHVVNPTLTPMAVGLLQPVIILPAGLLTSQLREGLRFTLLHELKHLQRRDNWWLMIESLVGAAYFFHPVIFWAKQKIHEEWEYICDRHVVGITKKPASYADFLLGEIWKHGHRTAPSLATTLIFKTHKTTKRVHAILKKVKPTLLMKIVDRIAVGTVSVCLISLLFCTVAPYAKSGSSADIAGPPSAPAVTSADPEDNGPGRSPADRTAETSSTNVGIPAGARIYDWKVVDDRNIIIRTRFYGNFKATLTEGYPGLSENSKELGFVSDWPYELDTRSHIILSNGTRCRIQKLVPYDKEIRGFYEIY